LDDQPSLKEKWVLTQEAFDRLLAWLDPDCERAGEKYEKIRSTLIKRFRQLRCAEPEELANETIDRVAKKLQEIIETYKGDPTPYFFSVAHYVHMEYLKKPLTVPLTQINVPQPDVPGTLAVFDDDELVDSCLERCMEHLTQRSREMILQYYCGERQIKIRMRKELSERMGIKLPNLRLKAQRVRGALKKCILDCMEQKALM
jgi:DNA-directed RNA polymerase specialized sigma24 family protein